MTVQELQQICIQRLTAIYPLSEATAITKILLENTTGKQSHPATVLKDAKSIEDTFLKLQLLEKQYPIQYIIQEAWFYKYAFQVNESVLIPRPETEELVDWLLKYTRKHGGRETKILDIGTGSGCIAITLKKENDQLTVTAIDISAAALAVAVKNARNLNTTVDFRLKNFLEENQWPEIGLDYDILVSNPPYIAAIEKNSMEKNVLDYEPHLALFVPNEDPLLYYKKLAKFGKLQKKPVMICCEINSANGKPTQNVFEQVGFSEVTVLKDMQGNDRILIAK